MQAEGGLERRANGKWKWKMEIVKGMKMQMENAGYLPEVAWPLSSPKRPVPLPPSRKKRNEKNEGETGRRADGFAAGT